MVSYRVLSVETDMQPPLLSWLTDEKFVPLVSGVLESGISAIEQVDTRFGVNVIDPFLMLFEMGSFNLGFENWITNEKIRQAQKTLSNHIGMFHQNVLGSLEGWENLGKRGIIDIVNHDKHIIAEIKNKHNTVKKSDQITLYNTLHDLVMPKMQTYYHYTAYCVEIIPKKPLRYDEIFTPPDRETGGKPAANKFIRKIDGASFYSLASGEDQALAQLYKALPKAIKIILQNMQKPIHDIGATRLTKFFIDAYGSGE